MLSKQKGYIGFALLLIVVFVFFLTSSLTQFFRERIPDPNCYKQGTLAAAAARMTVQFGVIPIVTTPCKIITKTSDNMELLKLVKGQGRNTTIIVGGKNQFIIQVKKHFPSLNVRLLAEIFDRAASRRINPVFVVGIWGAEGRFSSSPDPFGVASTCQNTSQSDVFGGQLDCLLFELDGFIKTFDKDNGGKTEGIDKIVFQGITYYYTDDFIYALEEHEVANHGKINDLTLETNFITYVKLILSG